MRRSLEYTHVGSIAMSVIMPVRAAILVMTALAGTNLQSAEVDSLDTASSEAGSKSAPAYAVTDAVLGKDQVKKQDEPRSEHEEKQDEYQRELEWREYPTDQRGSDFREYWEPSRNDVLSPESKDHVLRHRDRAVSANDFESTRNDSPGTAIGRASVLESVGDKATLPVTTPPSEGIELPKKQGDSEDKGQPRNAKKSDDERK
jgi:hypothetical protein